MRFIPKPGKGFEVWLADYEAFALLTGVRLLQHGWPQGWRFRDQVGMAFERIDMIMTPACAAMPWAAAEAWPCSIDRREVGPRGHAIYTGWVNVCGHPAISLPARPASNGLPVGFQLVADFGADEYLIDVAYQYEKSPGWVRRRPAGF